MERKPAKRYFNNGYRTWDGIQIGGQIYDPDTDFTQVCTEACQDTSYCVGCPFTLVQVSKLSQTKLRGGVK